MAHANIVDNQLVDDDLVPIRDLPFAERMASKFSDQIAQLASERDRVPRGWHGIFDHALHSLRAVDCPKRNGIEISEIAYGQGAIHLEVYYAPVDTVVRGILSCLSKRSSCTCEVCGRQYGAMYRQKTGQTLCARCHVHVDLATELRRWLNENGANRVYRRRPIIEFDSLPTNIKLLIPRAEIKCLRLVSDHKEVTYVTPDTITAHLRTLTLMKRYLDQP